MIDSAVLARPRHRLPATGASPSTPLPQASDAELVEVIGGWVWKSLCVSTGHEDSADDESGHGVGAHHGESNPGAQCWRLADRVMH